MTKKPPADRTDSQVDRCYALLRQLITTCRLEPGEHVNERELIEMTGYGRTPVREALLRLMHDGLVRSLPRAGWEVTPLTLKTADDLFDVWRLIGPLMVQRALERMTPQQREKVSAFELSSGAREGLTPVQLTLRSAQMFEIFSEAAGNEQLSFIHHRLSAEMARLFTVFFGTRYGVEWLPPEGHFLNLAHEKPERAAAIINEFIASSHKGIVSALKAKGYDTAPGKKLDEKPKKKPATKAKKPRGTR